MNLLLSRLGEPERRWYAAVEANRLGRGGVRLVAQITGLDEKTIRRFGVGYAPVGPDELLNHLRKLGYTTEEIVASGLARLSGRGRIHAFFRSRIM